MKKILKKLSVLVLIVAILLPFLELPKVNAQTDGCETHLQNYMFLDATASSSFYVYDKDNETGGLTTFGNFPYNFPEDVNYDVTVTKVTTNQITSEQEMNKYWALYGTVINYSAMNNTYKYNDVNLNGTIFSSSDEHDNLYASDTILLHGRWGQYDEDGEEINTITSDWEAIFDGADYSIQNIGGTDLVEEMEVQINGATFVNNEFYENPTTNLVDYFNSLIDGGYAENAIWFDSLNRKYVPLQITRSIDDIDVFNDYTFGYTHEKENKYYIFSKVDTTTEKDAQDSYDALMAYIEGMKDVQDGEETENKNSGYAKEVTKTEFEKVDFIYQIIDSDGEWEDDYVIYHWPFVLNVEYEVCPVAEEEIPEPEIEVDEWAVSYNSNVTDNSVINKPKTQYAIVGTDITIDSTKPSRDEYTFKGWCENANGSGNCYNPGDKVESPTSSLTKELYAQWGKLDTEENPKQGVVSYIIGFASVGIVAGGIYIISKKKNLFKQI